MSVQLSVPFLRQRIRGVSSKYPDDPRPLAVRCPGGWSGGESLTVDDETFRVVVARSSLEAREALASENGERIVLLTGLGEGELGTDVVARFKRNKLFSVELVETVGELFQATYFDPSLRERAVLEALVDRSPLGGYPPVAAGILSVEAIWRAFFEHVLGMPGGLLDLAQLLRWTIDDDRRSAYERAPQELKGEVRDHVHSALGVAGAAVLATIDAGHGRDALALAIVCEVLFGGSGPHPADAADATAITEARVRFFERYHGGLDLDAGAGSELANAARDLVAEFRDLGEQGLLEAALSRADAILEEIKSLPLAHYSSLTPRGLVGRLERFGSTLLAVLDEIDATDKGADVDLAAIRQSHRYVSSHRSAVPEEPRLSRVEMACRLVCWLVRDEGRAESGGSGAADFAGIARSYAEGGGWVDRARDSLVRGEELPTLSKAYLRLEQAAYARRRRQNERFGQAAAAWFQHPKPADALIPVEDAIDRVIAPVLESAGRALVIVLDGLSWQVAHQILGDSDLRQIASTVRLPGSDSVTAQLVATLPSVTEISRTSLLSGELTAGAQANEKKAFAQHPALLNLCSKKYPPVLFHKAELTDGGRGALSAEVEAQIASTSRKLVGVVINAIDDELSGAQQARDSWSADRISALKPLIRRAFDAGRVVVIASDHGHVYHRPGPAAKAADGGDRWRPVVGEPGDGEILVRGPRVRGQDKATEVIVPWDEAIHYGQPKNGYHGGVSPQELLAPVFALGEKWKEGSGLVTDDFSVPEWWKVETDRCWDPALEAKAERTVEPRVAAKPAVAAKKDAKKPAAKPGAQEVVSRGAPWIDVLFASPVYEAQRELSGKHAPKEEQLRGVIEALVEESGTMTPQAFASRIDVPIGRLAGFVSRLTRVLNVDGYDVFTYDREREVVELDVALLRKQFELSDEGS